MVPAARWAHWHDLAAGLGRVGGGHPQVGPHRRGQLAAVDDRLFDLGERGRAPGAGPPSTWRGGGTRPRWKVARLASAPSSPIRTLVAASSVTSSSMLFDTPSAHDACPAAVIGISPIRKAAERPRSGIRVNSSKVRASGTKQVGHVVVVAAGALEALHVPAVGEDDLLAGEDRHQQGRDAVVARPPSRRRRSG